MKIPYEVRKFLKMGPPTDWKKSSRLTPHTVLQSTLRMRPPFSYSPWGKSTTRLRVKPHIVGEEEREGYNLKSKKNNRSEYDIVAPCLQHEKEYIGKVGLRGDRL